MSGFFSDFFSNGGGGAQFAASLVAHHHVDRVVTHASTHSIAISDVHIVEGSAMVIKNGLILTLGEDYDLSETVTNLNVTLSDEVNTGDIFQVKYLCFHNE